MEELSVDVGDFWVGSGVKILENPTSVEFLRECVASYQPAILRGLIGDWPAIKEWDLNRICEKLDSSPASDGKRLLKVNLTPDGHGDCLKVVANTTGRNSDSNGSYTEAESAKSVFVYPAECYMSTALFQEMMEAPMDNDAAPYLSLQNDNLRLDMPELMDDVASSLKIAEEAFGQSQPEAVNLWIGDERSVSATHKDHFENMYAVISGEKTFILLPPTDILYLKTRECRTAKYEVSSSYFHDVDGYTVSQRDISNATNQSTGITATNQSTTNDPVSSSEPVLHRRLKVNELILTSNHTLPETISWIGTNPDDPSVLTQNPDFKYAHPIRCTVLPGEILYIPAMWYHQVSQTKLTIAVNYWYDQRFDFRYVFYQSINRLKSTLHGQEDDKKDSTEIS